MNASWLVALAALETPTVPSQEPRRGGQPSAGSGHPSAEPPREDEEAPAAPAEAGGGNALIPEIAIGGYYACESCSKSSSSCNPTCNNSTNNSSCSSCNSSNCQCTVGAGAPPPYALAWLLAPLAYLLLRARRRR